MSLFTNGNQEMPSLDAPRQQPDDTAIALMVNESISGPGFVQPAAGVSTSAAPSIAAFWGELDRLVSANAELRTSLESAAAKTAREALLAAGEAAPSQEEFSALLRTGELVSAAGTVVRTFWWGFHVRLSHQDLRTFVATAGGVNAVVVAIGGRGQGRASPWIRLVATFIVAGLALLGRLDRGNGVYISMSWFAPGVFVPTSA